MKRKTLAITTMAALGMGAAGAWLVYPGAQPSAEAADHTDPPARTTGVSADTAADIADVFAFTRGENTMLVLTFGGPNDPIAGQAGIYDPDVLYTIWVDEDGEGTGAAAEPIHIRFAENSSGHFGVQITGFPGVASVLSGPVEFTNVVPSAGGRFFVGLREDPFFFDLTGFRETLTTGEIAMMSTRDFFANRNSTAIVLEIPNTAIDASFEVWAATSRIGS